MVDLSKPIFFVDKVADAINKARLKKGWSQDELGHYSGLSRQAIYRIEGKQYRDMKLATVIRLCFILELDPRHLMPSLEEVKKKIDELG